MEIQVHILFGGVPEWPKGADCKSVAIASKVRILLPPFDRYTIMISCWLCAGVAELADAQDLKSCDP